MDTLLSISERSVALALLAALCLYRVKSASVKHAVWAVIAIGMLMQIIVSPVMPSLPLPVLKAAHPTNVPSAQTITISIASEPEPPSIWPLVIAAAYLGGVLFFVVRLLLALLFTSRLTRRAELIAEQIGCFRDAASNCCDSLTVAPPFWNRAAMRQHAETHFRLPRDSPRVENRHYQSPDIAVPITIGSRILLPLGWREWDAAKLRAVLAHEEAHARRRDWTVALLARINRCVFWFNPLAWWLERQLARLAEQACDDAALALTQDRGEYARALLDMARAVHTSNGRLLSAAMAKEANVETRINRILDENRRIPRALSRAGWTALLAVAGPLMYFVAAAQLVPAQTSMSIAMAPQAPGLIAQVAAPQPSEKTPAGKPTQAQPEAVPQPQPSPALGFRDLPLPPTTKFGDGNRTSADRAAPDADLQQLQQDVDALVQELNGNLRDLSNRIAQSQSEMRKALGDDGARRGNTDYLTFLNDRLGVEASVLKDRLAQAQTQQKQLAQRGETLQVLYPSQRVSDTESGVTVDVQTARLVTIGVPIEGAGEHEVYGRITTIEKKFVMSTDDVVNGDRWRKAVSLKPGSYRLDATVRSRADGTTVHHQTDFEIK